MKRREFTKIVGLGLLAIPSFPTFASSKMLKTDQPSGSGIPLGLCNHSLRGMKLNANQLIEYAIEQKLDSILLNTFQPFESLESSHLLGLRKMANANGISIYTGAGSICERSVAFTNKYGSAESLLIEGIRIASATGSPMVGCRIGALEDRYMEGGIGAHIEAVIKVMKSCRTRALDAGIKFAFENHAGDLRSQELLGLINETGTDICGALFDPANALWAMEDPMQSLNVLGKTIICTSVRDVAIWETDEGATFQGMAIGKGILDYPLYSKILNELCPGVPLHVETISNSARPIPYLKTEFWKGFPHLSTVEIVDFLRLAKAGKQIEIIKPPDGIDPKQFDIELQQSEFISSIEYLRKYCHAGLKSNS